MSVETAMISHIVRNGTLTTVIDAGIPAEYFTEEGPHLAYTWLVRQWTEYGVEISQEAFEREFPNFIIVVEPDPIEALIDELRRHYARTRIRDRAPRIMTALTAPLADFDLEASRSDLAELLGEISLVLTANETALVSEKIDTYLEGLFAMEGSDLPGIPTGFPTLDAASGGWQAENFGVIGAAPKRFKTAVLLWMALAAVKAGKRVKIITFEMSIKELMDRLACFGAEVNYTSILRGTLSDQEKRKLTDYAKRFAEWGGDIEIIHDVAAATTLAGLTSILRTGARPDILMIDGLYQMTDDSRQWSNETMALTAVSRGVKRLAAQTGIPIVGTSQALLSRISRGRGTEMGSLGYTSAFAQDANVIIGIDRDDMQSSMAVLKVIGARSMSGIAVNITVDLDNGTIYEGGEAGQVDDDYNY